MRGEGSPDSNRESLLAGISHRHFDQVIVDLRDPLQQGKNEVHGIGQIRPSLIGKMLVIDIQVSGPKTLELVERHLIKRLPPLLLRLICQC